VFQGQAPSRLQQLLLRRESNSLTWDERYTASSWYPKRKSGSFPPFSGHLTAPRWYECGCRHDGEGDSDAGEKEQGRSADQERHAQEDRRPEEDGCSAEACGTKEDRGEKSSGSEEGSGPEEAGNQESHGPEEDSGPEEAGRQESHNPEEGSDPEGHCEEGHCEEGHSSCLVSGCVSARNDTCSSGRNAVRSHRDAGQSRIQADHASRAGRFHPYRLTSGRLPAS